MHTETALWVYAEDKVARAGATAPAPVFGTIGLSFLSGGELRLFYKPEATHDLAKAFARIASDLAKISYEQAEKEAFKEAPETPLRQELGEDGPYPPSGDFDC